MPLPINRVPPGLVSLLDVKNYGMNPVQLGDQLNPVLDLGNAYAAANARLLNGTSNAIAAVGTYSTPAAGSTFVVPAGQLWIIEKCAVRPTAAIGAGVTCTFALCVYDTVLGPPIWASASKSGAATQVPVVGTDRQLIVPAGQGLGFVVEAIAGGNVTFRIDASVTVLTV